MQNSTLVTNLLAGVKKKGSKIWQSRKTKSGLSWLKIKYLKHASANTMRSFQYKGNAIFYTQPAEFLHTMLEIFEHEIYKLNLDPAPYILDCGANIGLGVIYLKEQFPDASIVAFEPDAANFALLKKNMASFRYDDVVLLQEAVWNSDTNLSFQNDGTMGSRIQSGIAATATQVKATRLKRFLNRNVDFLKIDIEGAEYEVIIDIADDLHKVQHLFLEYHGHFKNNFQLVQMLDIIEKSGFAFYIKEAAVIYDKPFVDLANSNPQYDVQLNIFCMRS